MSGLPKNLDAERAILASLLLRNELWRSAADMLKPQDFFLDAHRQIFEEMQQQARKYGAFDLLTLANGLNGQLASIGGAAYLADLTQGAVARSNITPLCKIVREKAALRRFAHQLEALQSAVAEPGATLEDCMQRVAGMMALCDNTPAHYLQVCPLGEFLTVKIPVREMVLAPVLPTQGLAMLYSKRGVGKTYLALGIVLAVARGGTFLRWKAPQPRRVLFVDGELPATTLQQRIRSIQAGVPGSEPEMPSFDYLRIITPDMQDFAMPDLATPEGQMLIERELGEADLLVLDNLSALCRSGKENEGESWLPVQEWLLRLRQQRRSVLLVHHAGKSGAQRGTSRREVLMCLLTGARRSNVEAMTWEQIDFSLDSWRIPETKNGESLTLPLSPDAVNILKTRKAAAKEGDKWVFPGPGSTGHLVEPKAAWKRILQRAQLSDLRIHDLRRTFGSWQAATGASLLVIGKSLGHKSLSATQIYSRLDLNPVRTSVNRATQAMLAAGESRLLEGGE